MTDQKKQGRPAFKEVTVQWPNVWTSKGKAKKGDKLKLDPKEIDQLGDAVK